jgi:hypothetical protein
VRHNIQQGENLCRDEENIIKMDSKEIGQTQFIWLRTGASGQLFLNTAMNLSVP